MHEVADSVTNNTLNGGLVCPRCGQRYCDEVDEKPDWLDCPRCDYNGPILPNQNDDE